LLEDYIIYFVKNQVFFEIRIKEMTLDCVSLHISQGSFLITLDI